MSRESLSGFPMSDIEYLIESDRWTALDKFYITQLLPTRYSINKHLWWISIGFPTKYSFGVWMDQADCWPNIYLVNAGVRWITDQIFSWCKQGASRLLTEYLFGVCRGQADYWPDIHSVYGIGQVDCWLNIHSVYAGIQQITNQIFIWCMQGSGRLPIGYSLIGLGGSELNI